MFVKIFHFKRIYFGKPVSKDSVFQPIYIHECNVKAMVRLFTYMNVQLKPWLDYLHA